MAKKQKSYSSQVAAMAPAFALKAVVGDLPKGGVEKAVESKLKGSKDSLRSLLSKGLKGRGTGRALGAGLGIATAPLFVGGLKKLTAKDDATKMKGLAMIGASTMAYQSTKGLAEGYREARVANMSKAKSVGEGLRLGAIRTGYKLPMALAMGLSVAAGRKKSKGGKDASKAKKLLAPALGGAVLGALSRGGEGTAKDLLGGKGMKRAFRGFGAKAAGGAAGGLLGGLVLGGVIDHAMKSLEKKGSVEDMEANSIEKLAGLELLLPKLMGLHAVQKAGMGYGRLGQMLAKSPLKGIVRSSEKAKTKQLAIGIREGLAGRQGSGIRSGTALNMGVPGLGWGPELKMQRELGISIGKGLRGVPPEFRVKALDGLKGFIQRNPSMRRTKAGEPVAVLNQLPEAVDMAVGRKALPGNRTLNKLLYGGRGGLGNKLPGAGFADKKSKFRENLGNIITGGGGLAMLAAGASATNPLTALPLIAVGGHGALSGIKNVVAKSDLVKSQALSQGGKGIREAFFPRLGTTRASRIGDHAMDLGISPGARDFGRMVGGLARGATEEGNRALKNAAFQKYINRAVGANKISLKDAVTPAVLAGGTGAGIYNLSRAAKDRRG